jgi:hypothetical protein
MLITDIGSAAPPRVPASRRIIVERSTDGTSAHSTRVGTVSEALHDPSVTKAEREAIRNTLKAIDLIRRANPAYSAVDHALEGVDRIVLGVVRSPAADDGRVLVPPVNPMTGLKGASTSKTLLPLDVAVHEIAHLVQESVSGVSIGGRGGRETRGMGGSTNFDAVSVAEGLADAAAAIETGRWRSGDEFFTATSGIHTVRDYAAPKDTPGVLSELRTHMSNIRHRDADPHVEGGLVGHVFHDIAVTTSSAQARTAVWGVMNDPAFAASNQGWFDVRDALVRQADAAQDRHDDRLHDAIMLSLNDRGFGAS